MKWFWRQQYTKNHNLGLEVSYRYGSEMRRYINGSADALVTFNQRDFRNVPSRFGIELLLPRDAIARIRR